MARSESKLPISERLKTGSVLDSSGCIVWVKAKMKNGYGQIWIPPKVKAVHRVAWEDMHGAIPDNLCVLHKCDNRACINTEHLFLGTYLDNMRDKVQKNRQSKGEIHPKSKLTTEAVCQIRSFKNVFTQNELSKLFHVTQSVISRIHSNKAWRV